MSRRRAVEPEPVPGPLPPEVVEAYLARCRAARLAAGLPERLEDRAIAARLAGLVLSGRPPKARGVAGPGGTSSTRPRLAHH